MLRAISHKTVISLCWLFVLVIWVTAYAGWTPEVRISEPGTSWYPQIAAQGDTLHVVYTNVAGGDKISYVRSTDGGITWSEHQVLSDIINSYNTFFPQIITFNSDVIVLWKNTINEGIRRKNIGYSISDNNGLTWTGPDYIFNPNWEHILYFASSGSDSDINLIFNSRIDQDLIFFNVRSTNFGSSWSEPSELFRANQSGLMDMAAYGEVFHYVWFGNFIHGEIWETYYIRGVDGGNNWSENIPLVDIDDYGSVWPSISTNELGHIIFCWTDFKYSPNWWTADLFVKFSYDNGENWTEESQITFSHEDGYPDVFWQADTVHVVWERGNVTQRSIFYLRSTDGGISWGDEQRLDNDPDDSYWPRVAASNGKVYAIWADRRYDPDNDIYKGIYFSRYDEDVGINNETLRPDELELITAYPNPFNSTVSINLNMLKEEKVSIKIYDISGRLVISLFKGVTTYGLNRFSWDATDNSGNKVSSGVYFTKIVTPRITKTVKLLYLK